MSARNRAAHVRRAVLGPVRDLLAARWASLELRRVRAELRTEGARTRVRTPPRQVSHRSGRVVMFVLRRHRATCLERSMLRQAWLAQLGSPRDIVIGVPADGSFPAHAWLDGDADGDGYLEIHRISLGDAVANAEMPAAGQFA